MRKPQAQRHSAQGDSCVLDSDRARTDVRETLLEPQERSLEPMIGNRRDDDGGEQGRHRSHQAGERSMRGWHAEHQYEQRMKDIEPVADAAEMHERPNGWSTAWRHLQTQCSNEQSYTGGGDSRKVTSALIPTTSPKRPAAVKTPQPPTNSATRIPGERVISLLF